MIIPARTPEQAEIEDAPKHEVFILYFNKRICRSEAYARLMSLHYGPQGAMLALNWADTISKAAISTYLKRFSETEKERILRKFDRAQKRRQKEYEALFPPSKKKTATRKRPISPSKKKKAPKRKGGAR